MRIFQAFAATVAVLANLSAGPAAAHFQLLYTPEVNVTRAGDVPLRLIFWHPFEVGHAMDMDTPQQFFVVHRGERRDLLDSLEPITFRVDRHNAAKAFAASYAVKRNGDYVFALVPTPYLETTEDIYIQQITKSSVNKGGIPTDWSAPLGLAAEIVPLNKPYGVLAGSTFSAVVLADGRPVAGAEVEVEFMAAEPDPKADRPGPTTAAPPPGGALVAVTDANGVFVFGVPRAGFWGFAALGIGPAKEHDGKPLSQDAVLWIHANEMK